MYAALLRSLTHGLLLLSSYAVFLVGVPILAHMASFRTELLPWLSYHLGLSLVPLDPHLLSVALGTFFIYFFIYFVIDVVYSIESLYAEYTGKTFTYNPTNTIPSFPRSMHSRLPVVLTTWNISVNLSRAHHQAVQYYPAFVLSAVLAWANTNQFDIYSTTFVMIQVISLFLLPITYVCPGTLICHLNRIAYQSALLWTIIYAICPRVVDYVTNRIANDYLANVYHFHQIL